ncbi:ankyrin, partial [Viridothelium virens]
LETACQQGKIEIIRLLVHYGANIDRPGEMGRTVLHVMARQGEDKVVNILTSLGASITNVDRQGLAAVHHAAICLEYSDCINPLIQAGAVIDQQDSYQWTALHWAARAGEADTVTQLLQAGADKKKTDKSGRTPLH